LDELFDAPIRKITKGGKKEDDFTLDFTKSGKGLGDEYAEEYANKILAQNPDVFDVNGADGALKKEIDDIFNGLMRNLN
jgi:hypothetical protein